jgi:polyphosphate kinase 2 (PPK2 family)
VELVALQELVKKEGRRICIVFEGHDGAGGGGTIKSIGAGESADIPARRAFRRPATVRSRRLHAPHKADAQRFPAPDP